VSADRGAVRRWPVLVVLAVLLAVGAGVQHHRDQEVTPPQPVLPAQLLPVAAGPGSVSSTWYCAAGTATGAATGLAEQTVVIENASGRSVGGRITAMTDAGRQAARSFRVPAHDHLDVRVSDVIVAPYAAAVVELSGGEVAVAHVLTGPTGTTTAACSSAPSADWYVPTGTTAPGNRLLLALFNPFPSDAVATVTFATDAGVRSPDAYDGLVIPGGQVAVLDVTGVVTLRTQLATTVAVREGRLIVDQLQSADGTNGTTKGLAVTPAAPRGAPAWWFADGPATAGARTKLGVQNPTANPVKVSVDVRLDANATVSPFEVTVAADSTSVIDVSGDGRVPVGVGFAAVARSAGGEAIVVDRVVQAAAPNVPNGFDVALGSPVLATRWLVPVGALPAADVSTLIVTNPSATRSVAVSVSTVSSGQVTTLAGTTRRDVIPPRGRAGFSVPTGAKVAETSLEVTSASPVVIESRLGFGSSGQSSALAVPVGTTATLTWSGRF
jgi:hypothetical protein